MDDNELFGIKLLGGEKRHPDDKGISTLAESIKRNKEERAKVDQNFGLRWELLDAKPDEGAELRHGSTSELKQLLEEQAKDSNGPYFIDEGKWRELKIDYLRVNDYVHSQTDNRYFKPLVDLVHVRC